MAADPTTRLAIPGPDLGDGPDGANVPYWTDRIRNRIDEVAAAYDQGTRSSRPPAGVRGRFYWATDLEQLWYDTGTDWRIVGLRPGTVTLTFAGLPGGGYLPCDGRAYSRTTYSDLFEEIGTSAGSGDGTTTFNVPDLRDRFPLGASGSRPRGAIGGEEAHLLTARESGLPDHAHHMESANMGGVPPALISAGGKLLVRGGTTGGGAENGLMNRADGAFWFGIGVGGVVGGARSAIDAHNNMPPYVALNAWIKA